MSAGVRSVLANADTYQMVDPPAVPKYVRGRVRLARGRVVRDKLYTLLANRPVIALDDLDEVCRQLPRVPCLRLQRAECWCEQLDSASRPPCLLHLTLLGKVNPTSPVSPFGVYWLDAAAFGLAMCASSIVSRVLKSWLSCALGPDATTKSMRLLYCESDSKTR